MLPEFLIFFHLILWISVKISFEAAAYLERMYRILQNGNIPPMYALIFVVSLQLEQQK